MQLAAKPLSPHSDPSPRSGHAPRGVVALGVIALVLAVVACGANPASDGSTPTTPMEPGELVATLFERLAAGEYGATAMLVDEAQLAIFTAIEGAQPAEVAGMVERGLPDQVRNDFWEGFVASLPLMIEESVDRAEVGEVEDLGGGFFAVSVSFPGAEQPAHWIVRDGGTLRTVDLFATFGPAFAPNLVAWYRGIPEGPERDAIRLAIMDGTDSLQVGLEHEPLGPWGEPARTGVAELLAAVSS